MANKQSEQRLFRKVAPEKAKTGFLPRIRVNQTEYNMVMERVGDSGRTYADYALNCMLRQQMRSYASATIINQLRVIAETQKQLAEGGINQEEHRQVLKSIANAIDNITQGGALLDP